MEKDFDAWNRSKQSIDGNNPNVLARQREVWWCTLDINVGVESNGKHMQFARPVVVMKVYNKESLLVLPLTSKCKTDAFHFEIIVKGRPIYAKLTQTRVVSSKRLLRKTDRVDEARFQELVTVWLTSLI